MRTRDDLITVFRALETQMDDYLDNTRVADAPGQAFDLVHTPERPGRRRRRVVTIASGLVAASAAVVLAVALLHSPSSDTPAAGDATLPLDQLVLSIAPQSDIQIVEARTLLVPNVQEADVRTPDGPYRIHVSANQFPVDNPHPVTVNGVAGAFGCPDPSQPDGNCILGWKYAPGAWVAVYPQGSRGNESSALRVARAIEFSSTTPLTSPIVLAHVPPGLHLFYVSAMYPNDTRAGERQNLHSGFVVTYYPDHGGSDTNKLIVNVGAGGFGAARLAGTEQVATGDRAEYWDARDHTLYVDDKADSIAFLVGVPPNWTAKDAQRVAADTTVVNHPGLTSNWRPVSDAIPPGS